MDWPVQNIQNGLRQAAAAAWALFEAPPVTDQEEAPKGGDESADPPVNNSEKGEPKQEPEMEDPSSESLRASSRRMGDEDGGDAEMEGPDSESSQAPSRREGTEGASDAKMEDPDPDRALDPRPDYLVYKVANVEEGKEVRARTIVTLQIPAGSPIFDSMEGSLIDPAWGGMSVGNKYCTSKARVNAVQFYGETKSVLRALIAYQEGGARVVSNHDPSFEYVPGETVSVDNAGPSMDPGIGGCTQGIHFYIDKNSAYSHFEESYQFPFITKRLEGGLGFLGYEPDDGSGSEPDGGAPGKESPDQKIVPWSVAAPPCAPMPILPPAAKPLPILFGYCQEDVDKAIQAALSAFPPNAKPAAF